MSTLRHWMLIKIELFTLLIKLILIFSALLAIPFISLHYYLYLLPCPIGHLVYPHLRPLLLIDLDVLQIFYKNL